LKSWHSGLVVYVDMPQRKEIVFNFQNNKRFILENILVYHFSNIKLKNIASPES